MVTSLRSVRPVRSVSSIVVPILALATLLASTSAIEAQLLENLQTFGSRLSVGPEADPGDRYRHGPKSIVAGDFDLSGTSDFAVSSTDGTITIYYSGDKAGVVQGNKPAAEPSAKTNTPDHAG